MTVRCRENPLAGQRPTRAPSWRLLWKLFGKLFPGAKRRGPFSLFGRMRFLLLVPSLAFAQQCVGMHNVRYWPYPVTDQRVSYKDGFSPDDPSGCCDLCCGHPVYKSWPQVWNLYGNGTCRCLSSDYNAGYDGPTEYGTGDWSGACAFRRPAATPAGLDSKKFKLANDTRIVALHRATSHYTCSYPNDQTDMAEIRRQAVESSKAAANGAFKWACGQCGAHVYRESSSVPITARFCAVALSGPNETSLAFAEQRYVRQKDEGGAYCQKVDGDFAMDQVLIGIDQGQFEVFNDTHGFHSVQQCSPSKPPVKCVPHHDDPRRPCHCDEACTLACCKLEPAAEEIAVRFSWYGLETSAPEAA